MPRINSEKHRTYDPLQSERHRHPSLFYSRVEQFYSSASVVLVYFQSYHLASSR
jgi:hypothetical protein